jgi:hypothetical protein
MRFHCKITIPAGPGNAAIIDGTIASKFQRVLGDLKPEAVYFGLMDGQRTVYLVVDVASADRMVPTFEPFWLDWNADVEISPVMTRADLEKGIKDFERVLAGRK